MYYLCFDDKKDMSYASAGRFVSKRAAFHPDRVLDTAVLLLGYSGQCPICQNGKERVLKKGTFQLLFPGVRHYGTGAMSEGQSHFWCHFYLPAGYFVVQAESSQELIREGLCVVPEFAEIDDCEKYFILFSQLIDQAEGENTSRAVSDAYVKIILCSLAQSVQRTEQGTNGERKLILSVKETVNRYAAEGVRVYDVAKMLKYDPDYITRIFRRHTGMTLSEYINSVRLQKAKNLLLNTDQSIAEIAYATGFTDDKYFMRTFKRYESVTPTQYRTSYFKRHLNEE